VTAFAFFFGFVACGTLFALTGLVSEGTTRKVVGWCIVAILISGFLATYCAATAMGWE